MLVYRRVFLKWVETQPPTRKMISKKIPGIDLAPCLAPPWWTLPSSMWCRRFGRAKKIVVPNAYRLSYNSFSYKNLGFYVKRYKMPRFLFDASSCDIFWKASLMTPSWLQMWRRPWPPSRRFAWFFLDPTSTASSFSTKNWLLWLPWYEETCWSWTTRPWFRLANSLSTARVF